MVESGLFIFFSRLAQAMPESDAWTKKKGFLPVLYSKVFDLITDLHTESVAIG